MYNKGKIVLTPFPFTDLSSLKVRPALIVSSNKVRGDDVTVVFISSVKQKRIQALDIKIKTSDNNFNKTGLKGDSIVKVNKIATLDKKIVLGELGEIGLELKKELDKKLKSLFEL